MTFLAAKCDQRSFMTLLVISQLTFLKLLFTVYSQKVHLTKTEHNNDKHLYTSDLNIRAHDCNI